MTDMERLLAPVEIAAILSVHVKTVRGWLNDPKHPLKGTNVPGVGWRISRQQLRDFMESGNE